MKRLVIFMLFAGCANAANFLWVLEAAPGLDFTHPTAEQAAILQKHGANLMRLRQAGSLVAGGRTQNPKSPRGIAIITASDQAEAEKIVAEDPAVKGGVLRATIEQIDFVFPCTASK